MFDESDVSVLTVVGVKSAKQLNSSAEYDVADDDDVEAVLVVWPGTSNDDPEVRGLKYRKIKIWEQQHNKFINSNVVTMGQRYRCESPKAAKPIIFCKLVMYSSHWYKEIFGKLGHFQEWTKNNST